MKRRLQGAHQPRAGSWTLYLGLKAPRSELRDVRELRRIAPIRHSATLASVQAGFESHVVRRTASYFARSTNRRERRKNSSARQTWCLSFRVTILPTNQHE